MIRSDQTNVMDPIMPSPSMRHSIRQLANNLDAMSNALADIRRPALAHLVPPPRLPLSQRIVRCRPAGRAGSLPEAAAVPVRRALARDPAPALATEPAESTRLRASLGLALGTAETWDKPETKPPGRNAKILNLRDYIAF